MLVAHAEVVVDHVTSYIGLGHLLVCNVLGVVPCPHLVVSHLLRVAEVVQVGCAHLGQRVAVDDAALAAAAAVEEAAHGLRRGALAATRVVGEHAVRVVEHVQDRALRRRLRHRRPRVARSFLRQALLLFDRHPLPVGSEEPVGSLPQAFQLLSLHRVKSTKTSTLIVVSCFV